MSEADSYIADLSPKLKELTQFVRFLVLSSVPGVEEKIKYNVPFYHFKGPLCYINTQDDHIILGFTKGFLLSNQSGILSGDTKVVRHIVLREIDDYPKNELLTVLHEAVLLNEETQAARIAN